MASRSYRWIVPFGIPGAARIPEGGAARLGGKGAGLAAMCALDLPVPPGFTISTDVCTIYYKEKAHIPPSIDAEIAENLKKLEKAAGAKLIRLRYRVTEVRQHISTWAEIADVPNGRVILQTSETDRHDGTKMVVIGKYVDTTSSTRPVPVAKPQICD